MLRLRMLGGLSLEGDEGPLTGSATQRRRLALLALLATAGDRGVSREKLVAYLWPEGSEEKARHTLAQMVYALRRDHGQDALVIGSHDARLNPQVISSDVRELEEALDRGDLEPAARLYGGPFLDGFHLGDAPEFERWMDGERDRLARRHRGALDALAAAAGRRGDHAAAVEWWRRLAALDPLDSRVAMGLMGALAAAGDRAGALQYASVHEALLREELGATPEPAVLALAARLRAERAAAADPAPAAVAVAPAPPPTFAAPDASTPTHPHAAPDVAHGRLDERALRRSTPYGLLPPGASVRRRPTALLALGAVAAAATMVAGVARVVGHRSHAEPAPVLAVGTIRDYAGGDTSGLARALGDMLSTNLTRVAGLHVISTTRLYEVVGQMRAGQNGDEAAAAAARAAQAAGATEIVEGALFHRPNGRLRLDVRRRALPSGALRAAYSVEGTDPYELADRATAELAAGFGARGDTLRIADVTTKSLTAYRLYEEGLRFWYQANDAQAALRLFTAALAEDSTFAMAAYYAGVIEGAIGIGEFDNKHFAQAVRMADRATDRERLLIRASWLGGFGEPASLAVTDTLAVRYPNEPDANFMHAESQMTSGEFLAAVPTLRRVIAMDSLSLRGVAARCRACDAFSALVVAYLHADSLPAAERVAREWVRLRPGSPGPLRSLEAVLESYGRYDESRAVGRAADRVQPGSPAQTALSEARLDIRAGSFAAADSLLAPLAADTSLREQGDALWLASTSLRYQGRVREALAAAAQLDQAYARAAGAPHGAHRWIIDAQVLLEMGRTREAAALFDSIAAHPPFEAWFRGKIARHRAWYLTHAASALAIARDTARLGALADSIEAVARGSNFGRDRLLHHHVRGLLLARRGDLPAAEAELRRAVYSPTMGYTRTNLELGRVLLAEHKPREAAAVLAPALRGVLDASNLYVTHTELHELLAQAYDQAGQADSAATHYRWVVNAWQRADPQFRPRWEAARARLAALERPRVAAAR